ncbi:hypothetical protein J2T23_003108 [Pseudarthrobacter niigatensis]|uniref:Uncharacterized protein n=1 Tax=Pseudarthrobacter niigatensis TaxID=369935 RepID=A0AAJ1STW0_9MICC|nr:hypothetical protein [Pseudarthrobacter niigatensis]MDQ0266937.1 hypothetical protein [Pseudarthrobacter niigatensis]
MRRNPEQDPSVNEPHGGPEAAATSTGGPGGA